MSAGKAKASNQTSETSESDSTPTQSDLKEYWRRNLKLIAGLFVIWFIVSFLFGIILAEPLSNVYIGNIPVPFWFAQQGSIIVFVILIFVYARQMNKLDREFGVED
ncbi:DUF4212 domain-containing protein [Halocatena marina]|uniref:DUF4212 domain-containing protein n=1 Tax=Halocatena marina TaxID=2934937 RepID=UPI00200FD139|nr:DUF4212 domain-containing protein [Halocatena marina]